MSNHPPHSPKHSPHHASPHPGASGSRVPVIAILATNSLMGMGLRSILESLFPFAAFKVCSSFEEIRDSSPEDLFHLFISASFIIEQGAFFGDLDLRKKTIVMTSGGANSALLGDYRQINISGSEDDVRRSIELLHSHAHHPASHSTSHPASHPRHPSSNPSPSSSAAGDGRDERSLSAREVDVLKLVVEGLLNKEIADRLGIGISTVITHRKNIVEKLGVRSVAGLTIYAVMKRYIEI